jgi:hypothetical protein
VAASISTRSAANEAAKSDNPELAALRAIHGWSRRTAAQRAIDVRQDPNAKGEGGARWIKRTNLSFRGVIF